MRKFLFVVIALLCISTSYSQPLKERKWDVFTLPIDSFHIHQLIFYDSTHGYLTGSTDTAYIDTLGAFRDKDNGYVFETSDGGKSWLRNTDTNLVGTSQNEGWGYVAKIHYANRQTRYAEREYSNRLLRSDDYGNSWSKVWDRYNNPDIRMLGTFNSKMLLAFDPDSCYLRMSYDGGITYPQRIGDALFHNTLWPDTATTSPYWLQKADIHFIKRDALRYTAIVLGARASEDTSDFSIGLRKLFPPGIRTLITENGGGSWKLFETPADSFREDGYGYGGLQYAKGTSNLYNFAGWDDGGLWGAGWSGSGGWDGWSGGGGWWGWNTINYYYSPDDGRTWSVDSTFARRRKAHEVVAENELWFTITKNEMTPQNYLDPNPAYIIARTTDNGLTYEYDSTTLNGRYIGENPIDGRMITFSDPRHGWIVGSQGKKTYIFRYDANEQPVSVNDEGSVSNPSITLSPVPAIDEVHITIPKDKRVENVEIYDIIGRKMATTFTTEGNAATASVRGFAAGSYVVIAKHQTGTYSRTLIVEPR